MYNADKEVRFKMNETIYVTGHRHPDSDSIVAAISYAYLKQQTGSDCVACRLGELNEESKYLLERFNVVPPYYLKDARISLADIELDDPIRISPDTTIREALQIMEKEKKDYCGVTDDEGKLLGLVTSRDISTVGLGDTSIGIDLLKVTSVKAISETIEGQTVYDDENLHLNGKVSIIALTKSKLENYEIRDRIVIVGDDSEAQCELIKKGAGVLIVVWASEIDSKVIETAKEYHCPIILSGHGSMNTSRYLYFSPSVKTVMIKDVTTFHYWELAEEVAKKMSKTRYRIYPVIDENGCLVGYVSRYHIMNSKNKNIILVDHNEFSQSVRAIEKAELLEVIDHHRISDFSTTKPVSFRNEIVGSTVTIITGMFQEKQIPIPKRMAGLMLGAILSDTLKFRSPTTTQKDIFMANVLAQIAHLNIDEFAKEMFSVSTDISGKAMLDLLRTDIKTYEVEDYQIVVSQVFLYSYDSIESKEEEINQACDELFSKLAVDSYVACFTSITDNSSKFYSRGKQKDWIESVYPEGKEIEEVLSRKNQIVPTITDVFTKNAE